jgi:hypothetical protein
MKQVQQYLNRFGCNLVVDGIIGAKTKAELKKYVFNQTKGITWVRCDKKLTNTFDDFGVLWVGGEIVEVFPCSTTAGKHYIQNPITYGGVTGTAIAAAQLVYGSHQFKTSSNWKSLWLGMPYFQQIKPIQIFRDGNKDGNLDEKVIQKGLFGINFHQAGLGNLIDNWSAGCQVVPKAYWLKVITHFKDGEIIDFSLIY